MRPSLLGPDELLVKLDQLPDWTVIDGLLRRDFIFGSFAEAMAFMAEMATVSERLDHHPTWTNTYQRVQVQLSTHDVGGLTDLDIRWAVEADRVAA